MNSWSAIRLAFGREKATIWILSGIFLLYLAVGALFALYTPPWQTPDEPAHYNYVAQVAKGGCCPVIEIGDWDSDYLSQLTSSRFAPNLLDDLDSLQYEDHQPPLYYLMASPIFNFTAGNLSALRLFSVILGGGVVISAFGIGCVMFPKRPQIALGAGALVAFLPQHVAMLASVNNDGLAECIIGITLLATVIYLKGGNIATWQLGVLVGIGLITKATTYFLLGVVPLAILLRWMTIHRSEVNPSSISKNWMLLLIAWAGFFIPTLILGSLWWIRNLAVYGVPDFLGLREHNLVVADQMRTGTLIAEVGLGEYFRRAIETTFNSFWGQFGWMALPMPGWIYILLLVLLLIAGAGLIAGLILHLKNKGINIEEKTAQRNIWIILSLTALLAVLAYVYYNTEFLQFQGRYMFPGLIPVSLWIALGLDNWHLLIFKRNINANTSLSRYLSVVVVGAMALLDIYLLWRVIVPGLSP